LLKELHPSPAAHQEMGGTLSLRERDARKQVFNFRNLLDRQRTETRGRFHSRERLGKDYETNIRNNGKWTVIDFARRQSVATISVVSECFDPRAGLERLNYLILRQIDHGNCAISMVRYQRRPSVRRECNPECLLPYG